MKRFLIIFSCVVATAAVADKFIVNITNRQIVTRVRDDTPASYVPPDGFEIYTQATLPGDVTNAPTVVDKTIVIDTNNGVVLPATTEGRARINTLATFILVSLQTGDIALTNKIKFLDAAGDQRSRTVAQLLNIIRRWSKKLVEDVDNEQ